MGPFKHRIDDGLDTRKAAFECMFTVLEVCAQRLTVNTFMDNVLKGLNDHNDIKMLMYLMLSRVAAQYPYEVSNRVDDFSDALLKAMSAKLKKNAVQQEVEKHEDLKRAAVRAVFALHKVPGSEKSSPLQALLAQVKDTPSLKQRW